MEQTSAPLTIPLDTWYVRKLIQNFASILNFCFVSSFSLPADNQTGDQRSLQGNEKMRKKVLKSKLESPKKQQQGSLFQSWETVVADNVIPSRSRVEKDWNSTQTAHKIEFGVCVCVSAL